MNNAKRKKMILCMVSFIFFMNSAGCGKKEKTPVLNEPESAYLLSRPVEKKDIYDISQYDGAVMANMADCSFLVSQSISEFKVVIGEQVSKGQVIALGDVSMWEEQKQILESQIEMNKKSNQNADDLTKKEIELLKLDLKIAKKEKDEEKEKALEKEIEIKKTTRDYEKNMRSLQISKLQSQCNELREQIEEGTLKSPCDGYVSYIVDWTFVQANETVALVADHNDQYIVVDSLRNSNNENAFSYDKLTAVIDGKEYEIKRDFYSNKEKAKAVQNQSYLPMKFSFVTSADDVEVGKMANVFCYANLAEDVLAISKDSLYEEDDTAYVYVLEENQKIKREVTIGKKTETEVEIITGLAVGEQVYYFAGVAIPNVTNTVLAKQEKFLYSVSNSKPIIYNPITKVVSSEVDYAVLETLEVEDGQVVRQGERLGTLTVSKGSAQVMQLENQITQVKKNRDSQIKVLEKQIKTLEKEIEKQMKKDKDSTYEIEKKRLEIDVLNIQISNIKMECDAIITQSQKELGQLKSRIGTVILEAPMDGTVSIWIADCMMGERIAKNTLICQIASDELVYLAIQNNENRIRYYDKVKVCMEGETEIAGRVVYANTWTHSISNQMTAYIALEDEYDWSSTSGTVEMAITECDNAILIPKQALLEELIEEEKKYFVWVSDENQNIIKRYVSVACNPPKPPIDSFVPKENENDEVWILQGLKVGEIVIVPGGEK